MRAALALALVLAATAGAAGCGGSDVSAPAAADGRARPSATARSNVFTVPAELPPPARTATTRRSPVPTLATTTGARTPAPGAPSDAEVRRELAHALGVADAGRAVDQAGLGADGLATVPPSAPRKVAAIISAANQVARAPYRYGGGHGGVGGEETWVDTAYDCSGSVSFALASAGLVSRQLDSSALARWGKPGRGHWVTVYANAGHAFMVVAGLRFDTVERSQTGTRWGAAPRRVGGFTARHPAGL